jgi:hypothetical protein
MRSTPLRSLPFALRWLLLFVFVAGCSSTQVIAPGEPIGQHLNETLAGQRVDVTLRNGRLMPALSLVVNADSTTWIDPDSRDLVSVSTAEVATVEHRSRRNGLVQGALIAGLTTGAVVFLAKVREDWDFSGRSNSTTFAADAGLLTLIPGTLLGAGIGYRRGSEARYVIRPSSPTPPTLPSDSSFAARVGVAAPAHR